MPRASVKKSYRTRQYDSKQAREAAWKARASGRRAAARSVYRRGNRSGQSAHAFAGSAVKQSMNPTLFPNGMKAPMVYSEEITFAVGTGTAPVSQAFRANSLFDPNHTGVGSQPRFFDTLLGADGTTAPYGRYKVNACKAEITARNTGTSAMGIFVGILGEGVSHPANWAEACMRSNSITKVMTPSTSSGSLVKLDMYKTIASLYPNQPHDADLVGTDSANPAKSAYVYIDVFNLDGAGTVTVVANCKLTYYSEFSERLSVAAS